MSSKKNVLIIAEAGVNHNGDINLAKELIHAVGKTGADAVKFQTFVPTESISKYAQKAEYQKKTTGAGESQLEMVSKLALSNSDFIELKKVAENQGLLFLSTPFDFPSIQFLHSLDIPLWKIPSGEITNKPYLQRIASLQKKVLLSTGMASIEEVEMAIEVLRGGGCKKITLLHCTTEYPAPKSEVNLRAMLTMRDYFKLPVGYSDHTQGIEIPIAAVAMGATVIEKHITLDNKMEGPDHAASLEPSEFEQMVSGIRNVELSLGDGVKKPTTSELRNMKIARKSIVARKSICRGEIMTADKLSVKRPGTGVSPMLWDDIIGTIAKRDYEEDELIEL